MKKVLHFIDESLEEAFAVIAMALMAVIMGIQVIARYVFNSSLSWPEEVSVYLLIWMGMLSLSYCIRKNASIKVEMIIDLFPEKVRKFFHLLEDIISILFYGLLTIPAWQFFQGVVKSGQVSPACGLPMYYVQSAPFFCFILTAFRIVQRWFGEWRILLGKEKKPLEEGDIASVIEEAVVENPEHADAANMDKSGVTVRKEK